MLVMKTVSKLMSLRIYRPEIYLEREREREREGRKGGGREGERRKEVVYVDIIALRPFYNCLSIRNDDGHQKGLCSAACYKYLFYKLAC
jgi:hypothetical protein